jgi:hypothetical protein
MLVNPARRYVLVEIEDMAAAIDWLYQRKG